MSREAWGYPGAAAAGEAGDEVPEGAWGVVLGRAWLLVVRMVREGSPGALGFEKLTRKLDVRSEEW